MKTAVKWTRAALETELELLKHYGNESGQHLHAFILESFDGGMGEGVETPMAFIRMAIEVWKDLKRDEEPK